MQEIFDSLGLTPDFATIGEGALPSRYTVTDLAVTAYGAVGQAMVALLHAQGHQPPAVTVNRVLASRWYGQPSTPSAGRYRRFGMPSRGFTAARMAG